QRRTGEGAFIDSALERGYKNAALSANHSSDTSRLRRQKGSVAIMILGKFWGAFRAQINKLANLFWTADPIAQMQYEYDLAVSQMKQGREGLEQYRALVERVSRQVAANQSHVSSLEAKVKAYLSAGDRESASKFALE